MFLNQGVHVNHINLYFESRKMYMCKCTFKETPSGGLTSRCDRNSCLALFTISPAALITSCDGKNNTTFSVLEQQIYFFLFWNHATVCKIILRQAKTHKVKKLSCWTGQFIKYKSTVGCYFMSPKKDSMEICRKAPDNKIDITVNFIHFVRSA